VTDQQIDGLLSMLRPMTGRGPFVAAVVVDDQEALDALIQHLEEMKTPEHVLVARKAIEIARNNASR
jgi:hypothetical protein